MRTRFHTKSLLSMDISWTIYSHIVSIEFLKTWSITAWHQCFLENLTNGLEFRVANLSMRLDSKQTTLVIHQSIPRIEPFLILPLNASRNRLKVFLEIVISPPIIPLHDSLHDLPISLKGLYTKLKLVKSWNRTA